VASPLAAAAHHIAGPPPPAGGGRPPPPPPRAREAYQPDQPPGASFPSCALRRLYSRIRWG
jgi:hypothetical protein